MLCELALLLNLLHCDLCLLESALLCVVRDFGGSVGRSVGSYARAANTPQPGRLIEETFIVSQLSRLEVY